MVYVGQSLESRKWGYQIIQNADGAMRILEEEYLFNAPGEVFEFMERIKKAQIRAVRDAETRAWGYAIVFENAPVKEQFGFETSEEASNFIADLRSAITEGVKMRPDAFSKATTMRFA